MNKTLCIYHGNCADGFGAAWVVRRVLGAESVEFCPAQYGSAPPDVTGRDVLIVDFSYKRPALESMIAVARSVLVIDHHKTAAEDLAWMQPVTPWEVQRQLLSMNMELIVPSAVFDMDRSGAGLTWDYFKPGCERPRLINHIEDRDLWRFKLPGTRELHSVLMSMPYDFDAWDELSERFGQDPPSVIAEGAAIDRAHLKNVHAMIEMFAMRAVIAGHDVPVCNMPYHMASDAGNIMSEGEKFAATYIDGPKGRGYSLRSRAEGLDVSEIAKLFGGGGHRNAAGFTVPPGMGVAVPPSLAKAMLGDEASF